MKNKLAQLINYAYVYGKHKATTLKWLLLFMIFVMGVSFFPRYGMIYLFAPMAEPTIYYTWLFGFGFLFVAYYFKDFEEVNTKISTKRLNTREIANSYPTELMSLENKVAYLFVAITSLVLFPIFYTLLYLTVFALSNWLFKMFWDYQQLEWFVPFITLNPNYLYNVSVESQLIAWLFYTLMCGCVFFFRRWVKSLFVIKVMTGMMVLWETYLLCFFIVTGID